MRKAQIYIVVLHKSNKWILHVHSKSNVLGLSFYLDVLFRDACHFEISLVGVSTYSMICLHILLTSKASCFNVFRLHVHMLSCDLY